MSEKQTLKEIILSEEGVDLGGAVAVKLVALPIDENLEENILKYKPEGATAYLLPYKPEIPEKIGVREGVTGKSSQEENIDGEILCEEKGVWEEYVVKPKKESRGYPILNSILPVLYLKIKE